MWTGKKDRGRGTAIGVVQDQLSPLLWVALYLPQNPKTRSNTEINNKMRSGQIQAKQKNTPSRMEALPRFACGSLASGNPASSYPANSVRPTLLPAHKHNKNIQITNPKQGREVQSSRDDIRGGSRRARTHVLAAS